VDEYIKLENGIKYGVADEMVLNNCNYLFLVNDKDPHDYCIKKCVAEEEKAYIVEIENAGEFNTVLDRFMDSRRNMNDAMRGLLDYLTYGEIKNRNEMSQGKFVFLHIVLFIPILLNFLVIKIAHLGVQRGGEIITDNLSTWSYILILSVISLCGVLITIKNHRTFSVVWSNTLTVIGLTMAIILFRVSPAIVIITLSIWLLATAFYIIRAFRTKAPGKTKYIRIATQRLTGAYHVSRSLLAATASLFVLMFIFYIFTGQITILTDNIYI